MTCISTICFFVTTIPKLQSEETSEDVIDIKVNSTQTALIDFDFFIDFNAKNIDYNLIKLILNVIDWLTMVYFCLEYVLRFICAPDKKKFFFQVSWIAK